MTTDANKDFGLPEVPAKVETPEERMTRLQALADIAIGQETDAEVVARLVAEARQKRAMESMPKDTSGLPKDYSKIFIYAGADKHALSYVPLGLNGYAIKVPRDVEVILPTVFVTECLDHAIETEVTQGKGGLVLRSRHRFPYILRGKATPEEYAAFQKQQRELAERDLRAAA